MGFIKKTMFYGFGLPVRPTSRKERLYRHQMGYDDLSIGNFVNNVFGSGDTASNQSSDPSNTNALQNQGQSRVACPTCAELSPSQPSQIKPTSAPASVVGQKQLNKIGGMIEKIVDQSKASAAEISQCPTCKGQIIKGATKCRYCKSVIGEQV